MSARSDSIAERVIVAISVMVIAWIAFGYINDEPPIRPASPSTTRTGQTS